MTEQCKRASCTRREEQLRARIAELEAENIKLKRFRSLPMKYRRMAFNAELQEQLAAHEAIIEQMREALSQIECLESPNGSILSAGECSNIASEAIDLQSTYAALQPTTEHLDAYVKGLLGEPVAWVITNEISDLEHYGSLVCYASDMSELNMQPLYALKEQK